MRAIVVKVKRYSDRLCSVEGLRRGFLFEADLDRLRRAGMPPLKEGESLKLRLSVSVGETTPREERG